MPSNIAQRLREQLRNRTGRKAAKHPLDLPYSGNTETDDVQELSAVQSYLKKGKDQISAGQDMGYYVPLVFLSREQMKEFLQKTGWDQHLDWSGAAIDGLALAKALHIPLSPVSLKFREKQSDIKLVREVGIMEG